MKTKTIMMCMLVLGLAACEQNHETTIKQSVSITMQKEAVQAETGQEKVIQTQQADSRPEAMASTDKIASTFVKQEQTKGQSVAAQPVKEKPSVAKAEVMQAPAAKAKAESKVASKVKPTAPVEEKVVAQAKPEATGKKRVAPLVQGKQPIKQQPNPAPVDNMQMKPAATMSLEKANALTKKCKSCHATDKDKVGPSYKKIQEAYGSVDALAAVFENGFAVEHRKVAASDTKWKKKVKTMTSQYKNLIQKQVEKGKLTYKEMAEAIFAK